MNNKPKLIDMSIFNTELELHRFYTNTTHLNIILFSLFLLIILLTIVFSKNYSKKKAKKNLINKLNYIKNKSRQYITAISK